MEYDYEIFDNQIYKEFQLKVWEYLSTQTWYLHLRYNGETVFFNPNNDGWDWPEKLDLATKGTGMSRALFAPDEETLKAHHLPIYLLWKQISRIHGDRYELAGPGEDAATDFVKQVGVAQSARADLDPGWRAYTNGQGSERIKRSHGIHRDTIKLDDDTTRTILYVANPVWLPSWMGEIIFYGEDPEGTTGDHQQFQQYYTVKKQGRNLQRRDFKIGWPKAIIPAVPGRIISYDGRTLHTTKPTSEWAPHMRVTVAFRARLKKVA